ncbi:MAG: hypothetical protein K0R29_2598 [Pseudobdellovibrio sp.]|nr:hypothetical protein [Pseudobdellovibrio sp.]
MKTLKAKLFLCVMVVAMQAMKFAWADINTSDQRRDIQSETDAVKMETEIHGSAARAIDSICQDISLPARINIKPVKPLIVGSPFRKAIYDDKNQIVAYITQNAGQGQFAIYDLNKKVVLTGKASSGGDVIELFNCGNAKIGVIKRDTERSFLTAASSFDVQDDQGNLIFRSEKKTESSPLISVLAKDKSELASLLVRRNDKTFEASLKKEAKGENALLLMATLKAYDDANK